MGDMFGDLFGGAGRRRRGPMRGPDVESEITIDFAEAVKGGTFTLRAAHQTEPITVRIPPGAEEGSRVRLAGQGGAAPAGGQRGDLVLGIHVRAHPFFRREGPDLHLGLPITIGEAFKGARVRVPTPDGPVTLKVPPHTQSGQTVRLKGKGVPGRAAAPAGDLYVRFEIRMPSAESSEVRAAIDTLEDAMATDVRAGLEL
jgi:curved DNA-binding protein